MIARITAFKKDQKRQQMLKICLCTTCMYGSVINCQMDQHTGNVQQVLAAPYMVSHSFTRSLLRCTGKQRGKAACVQNSEALQDWPQNQSLKETLHPLRVAGWLVLTVVAYFLNITSTSPRVTKAEPKKSHNLDSPCSSEFPQ